MKRKNENNNEELTAEGMNDLLLELSETVFWKAIHMYSQVRYVQIDNGLRTIDPFKNPTEMARTQGFFGGVSDLAKYVEELKKKAKEAEVPESEIMPE